MRFADKVHGGSGRGACACGHGRRWLAGTYVGLKKVVTTSYFYRDVVRYLSSSAWQEARAEILQGGLLSPYAFVANAWFAGRKYLPGHKVGADC